MFKVILMNKYVDNVKQILDINFSQWFVLEFSKNVHIPCGDTQITEDLSDNADTHWQRGVSLVKLNELGYHRRETEDFKKFENLINNGQYMFNDNKRNQPKLLKNLFLDYFSINILKFEFLLDLWNSQLCLLLCQATIFYITEFLSVPLF